MKIPVDVFYSVIDDANKAKQKHQEELRQYEAELQEFWQQYQQEWTAKGVQPNLALRAPGVANVLAAINQALAPTAGMLSPERMATFAQPAEPQAPITPFREVTQAPMGYAPRSAMPDLGAIAPPVKPIVPESVPGKAAARVVESFLQQMPGGRAVDVTETGKPGVDVATGLVGGTTSQIAQLIAAQKLATLAAGALVSERARKALPPLATALATSGLGRTMKWGAHKVADPESVTGKDLGRDIAFGLGATAAGDLVPTALRHAFPGIHPLIEAPVTGAAAGAAGAVVGYPFSDRKGMDYLKDMGNTILAQAILQTVWTAGSPQTWKPRQNFGRSMASARKYHDDIFEAFEGNNERAANIAYREFQKNIDNALHYAHQAGATPDPAAWRAKAEDVILQGFKMRGWTPHAEAPTPEPATGPAAIPAPKPELPAPVEQQAPTQPVVEPTAPAVQPVVPMPTVEPTPAGGTSMPSGDTSLQPTHYFTATADGSKIPVRVTKIDDKFFEVVWPTQGNRVAKIYKDIIAQAYEPIPTEATSDVVQASEMDTAIQSPLPEPIPEPEPMPESPEKASDVSPDATKQVTIQASVNRTTANAADLAADYKARGIDRQAAYGAFVQDRDLKPEMDAKAFLRIFDSVSPAPLRGETQVVDFKATHMDTATNTPVMATLRPDGKVWDIVMEWGSVGSSPDQHFHDRYKPLEAETKPETAEGVASKPAEAMEKEPWQMTKEEFARSVEVVELENPWSDTPIYTLKQDPSTRGKTPEIAIARSHRNAVSVALMQKKPIPPEVLAEYPEEVEDSRRYEEYLAKVADSWRMRKTEAILLIDPLWFQADNPLQAEREAKEAHKRVIRQALAEGKPVPPEVLADYPGLEETAPEPASAEASPEAAEAPEIEEDSLANALITDRRMRSHVWWEMTRQEFISYLEGAAGRKRDVRSAMRGETYREIWMRSHKALIKYAIKKGYYIPPEVLADYPDLAEMPAEETAPEIAPEAVETPKAEGATGLPISVSRNQIDFETARTAHLATSWDADNRAREVQTGYVKHMQNVYEELKPLAETPEQEAILKAELERYRQGYVTRINAVLSARSKTMNPMITGRAGFPTASNRKWLDIEANRITELNEWTKKAVNAIKKRLKGARTPEQSDSAEFKRLKGRIDSNIATIREIQDGKMSGFDINAFKTSIADAIKRSIDNGNVDAGKQAIDYLREAQKALKKPAFTNRHSIWNYAKEKAAKVSTAVPVETEEQGIAKYEGAHVVNNLDEERVQIFFDDKPTKEIRDALKKSAWNWSPSNKAWQRKNTPNAIASANMILSKHLGAPAKPAEAHAAPTAEVQHEPEVPASEPAREPLPPVEPATTGKLVTVKTERGTAVDVEYAIIEADSLISSHNTALIKDPRFPEELQPRERARTASEAQITRIANMLEPEFLGESPKASEGAPIVGPDGVVESGNARVIALKRVYEEGKPGAAKYKAWLAANADRFGLDRATLENMESPVLVRIRKTDLDREQFVREANEAAVAAMSATEQAMADAKRMSGSLMTLFRPNEDGEISTVANRDFIRGFMDKVVGPTEQGRYMTADGVLSQDGISRIRNAVFARAYGDPTAMAKLAESPDNNVRNVTGAMLIVAPRLADIKERIEAGNLFDLDITEDIAAAMKKLSELREQGMSVKEYMMQMTMFEEELSPFGKELLVTFEEYGRSRKRITELLHTYADTVIAAGDPKQQVLFGEQTPPTKREVLEAAIRAMEVRYGERDIQGSLFGGEASGIRREAIAETGAGEVGGRRESAEGHVTAGGEAKRPVEDIRAHREDEAPETIETPTPKTEGKSATIEPVGKQDIIRYMSENLLVPIRVGRMFSKRARGEYKINQRVARLKKANNLPTAFHEVGHHLEQVMELSARDLAGYDKELLPLLGTRYANATPAVRLSEGFAEFFRLYMTEPDAAKKAAPSFYDYFDELVDKNSDDLRKHIDTAKDMHKQYHMQSAADRVGAMIVDTPPETQPFLTKKEQIYTDWVDDLYPLYKAMKELYPEEITSEKDVPMHLNAYVLRRLANSSPRSAAGMLTNGMSSPELEVIGPSYKAILEPVADRLEEFERYITALHALEIEDRGMESGFDRADCEATIELYDCPEFRKAAEGRERFMDNLLDWLVDSGALSQSSVTAMRKTYEHHVSFYRVFDEGGLRGPRHGGKKTVDLPRPVKRQYGSTRPIYSPIQNDILNTFYFMDIAKRSYAAKALAGLADKAEGKGWLIEKVPAPQQVSKVELKRLKDDLIAAGIPEEDLADADLERIALVFNPQRFAGFKEKQENIFAIHRGERVDFYQVHPDLYATLQALDTPASNWLIRLLGSISEPLHVGAVGTLSFGGRNIVKDTSTKLIHSEATPIDLGKDFVKGFAHALKKDDLYAEYEASGGGQAGRVSLSRHDLEKKVADMFPKNERATTRVINAFAKPYVALKGLIELGEEGSRIGEFARRRGDDPTREDKLWAAYLSREVTVDFQRGGRKGRQWNLVVRFFNPGLQGTDKLARDFKANPGRVLLRGALISLISLLTFLKNKDNPRYLDESRYRRDNFWCFYPTESINLYIPKGFEAGMIFGSAPERFLEWMYHKDPGAMKEFAKSVFDELSPDIIPTAMVGLVEQIANKSLLTGAPIVPAAEQRLEPRDQYGPQTTAPAITLGQALNVSPRRIEAMIGSYTGGMGLEVLDFLDLLAGEATSKRAPTQLIPGVKGFVGRPYVGSRAVTQLYEEKEKLERQKASYDRAWKQGKEPKTEPNWARLDLLRSTADYLTTLRKERDWIMEESGYAPTEKRKRVDDINRQIAEEAQKAMKHFVGM